MSPNRRGAIALFGAAAVVLFLGVMVAFARYPGGYDWAYTVISKLASLRQNPDGGRWLTASLLAAVVLLWPVTGYLRRGIEGDGLLPRVSVWALRIGLLSCAILGIEGVLDLRLSGHLAKAHEGVALLAFLGFYGGVLGLHAHRVRDRPHFLLPALLVVIPLLAVGVTQLVLYFDQRDLGWVGPDWRAMGVPIWLSFAFWQWLAVIFLGVGLGWLVMSRGSPVSTESVESDSDGPGRG